MATSNYPRAFRLIRAAADLNQAEFAAILGVTPSYVCYLEKGQRPCTAEVIATIGERLGVGKELFDAMASEDKKVLLDASCAVGKLLLDKRLALRARAHAKEAKTS